MPYPYGCLQSTKHEERKSLPLPIDFLADKPEKKERVSKGKDKREKITEEEKELRKERKLGRKRVRCCLGFFKSWCFEGVFVVRTGRKRRSSKRN